MGLLGRIFVAVAVVAVVGAALAHAQAVPDGPTAVVTMPSAPADQGWSANAGDISWPIAAYTVVSRFLSVLERMVTDTRGWLDRWLDKTGGKFKIDFKRTGVTIPFGENDPDRSGPIPRPQRRRDDPGRNGTAPHDEDEPAPQ